MSEDNRVVIDDKEVREMLSNLIKNVGKISEKAKEYVGLLSSVVFRDLIRHFENQEGPDGKWKPWSPRYANYMAKIGKSGNLILTDTGRLRQGWQPTRYRIVNEGVIWFNPVSYGKKHNEGIAPFPKRQFAWISKDASDEMERQTLKFVETIK